MYIIRCTGIRYDQYLVSTQAVFARHAVSANHQYTLPDINSRCKITAFFAHKCAYIRKKCVKIDTFVKKSRARTIFICIYEIFFVILCPVLWIDVLIENCVI